MKTAVQKSASQINLDNFFHELRRVNNTYPEDGGRERLYELVGNGYKLYIYFFTFGIYRQNGFKHICLQVYKTFLLLTFQTLKGLQSIM